MSRASDAEANRVPALVRYLREDQPMERMTSACVSAKSANRAGWTHAAMISSDSTSRGPGRGELRFVDGVDTERIADDLAHRGVDRLAGGEGCDARARERGQVADELGKIAFVRNADEILAGAHDADHFSGRGQK
jgi:hypothetical protein